MVPSYYVKGAKISITFGHNIYRVAESLKRMFIAMRCDGIVRNARRETPPSIHCK